MENFLTLCNIIFLHDQELYCSWDTSMTYSYSELVSKAVPESFVLNYFSSGQIVREFRLCKNDILF